MANFSGAGGYAPLYIMLAAFATFPATLLVWTGIAITSTKENGTYNWEIVKRKLRIALLILFAIAFIPTIAVAQISGFALYSSSKLESE